MVKIVLRTKDAFTEDEKGLVFSLLELMCTNKAFYEHRMPVTNDKLFLKREMLDEQGNPCKETEPVIVTYRSFVTAINRGLNTSVDIAIQTEDGKESISVPLFPVTLTDVPICKRAMVTLDYKPDFDAHLEGDKVNIGLTGKLLDFVNRDVDEKAKDNNGD